MIVDWLYRTTLETSVLIALVLILRPLVKRLFGAKVAYGLWVLPLLRVLLPDRPERSNALLEALGVPAGNFPTDLIPIPELTQLPGTVPWITLWLTGLFLWLALRGITWIRFHNTLKEQSLPLSLPPHLREAVLTKLNWNIERVDFFICQNPSAPFVTGLIKPAVYLPEDFYSRFTQKEQIWVLIHELTHIKRKDLWVQWIGECVRTVFWFNPIIHFAIQVVQEDQELACDSSILGRCSTEERLQYGKALAVGMGPHLAPSILTFFSRNRERFTMLSKHKVSKLNTVLGITLCTVVSIFALTKAPTSVAQLSPDVEYDPNAPVLIRGIITNVELFDTYSFFYVDAVNQVTGETQSWVVDGGPAEEMIEAGITNDIIGREVMIRGYQTIDKSCTPLCRMNGRDLTFEDA